MDAASIVPTGAPLPPLPASLNAVVESVVSPHRYALRLQSMLLEVESQLLFQPGDLVAVRVKEQSASRLVLELARPAAATSSSDADAVPERGLPRDPALVARIGRLDLPAPEPEASSPFFAPFLRALVAESPAEIAARAAVKPRDVLHAAVDRALAAAPRLRMLDVLIEALASRPADPGASPAGLAQAWALLSEATPETAEAALARLPALSREALTELEARLADLERREMSRVPALADARAGRGSAIEHAERQDAVHLANQVLRLRGEDARVVEIPLRGDGPARSVLLRFSRERGARGEAPGPGWGVTLDVELSVLGPLRARLDLLNRALRVRLRMRDKAARERVEAAAGELVEALRALGFEATVAADVAPPPRESIFGLFVPPGEQRTLDVEA